MSELKRYHAKVRTKQTTHGDSWTTDNVYLASEVDALLSERDRREGELRARVEELEGRLREVWPEFDECGTCGRGGQRHADLLEETIALRQQLRELTEWRKQMLQENTRASAESQYCKGICFALAAMPLPPLPKEVE